MNTQSSRPGFNDGESPLMRLYLRKGKSGKGFIDATQFAASERLRTDFERSMMSARVTFAYQEPVGGRASKAAGDNHYAHLTDSAFAARERVHHALEFVGPELSGMLMDVVCLASGLEQAERRLHLPVRSGKVVLSLALSRLARHYGMAVTSRKGVIAGWAAADARPVILPREG
jgi:hypothetical protein